MKRIYNDDGRLERHLDNDGRAFYSAKCISEFKKDLLAHNGWLKREGKVDVRLKHIRCGCRNPNCTLICSTQVDRKDYDAYRNKFKRKLPPPTKHPKRKEHPMFRGKIIDSAPVKTRKPNGNYPIPLIGSKNSLKKKSASLNRRFMVFQDEAKPRHFVNGIEVK